MLLRAKVSLVCIFLCVSKKIGWTWLLNLFFPWLYPNFFCEVTLMFNCWYIFFCFGFSLIELSFKYEVCLQFSCLVVKNIIIDLWYLPWLCKFLVTAYVRYLPSLGDTVQYTRLKYLCCRNSASWSILHYLLSALESIIII